MIWLLWKFQPQNKFYSLRFMDHGNVSDKKYEIQPLMQSVQTNMYVKPMSKIVLLIKTAVNNTINKLGCSSLQYSSIHSQAIPTSTFWDMVMTSKCTEAVLYYICRLCLQTIFVDTKDHYLLLLDMDTIGKERRQIRTFCELIQLLFPRGCCMHLRRFGLNDLCFLVLVDGNIRF